MRERSFASVSVLAGLVSLVACASAFGHGIGAPSTDLRVGSQSQRGGLVWEEWSGGSGGYCVEQSGDGTGAFPPPLEVSAGTHRARFVFDTRRKPKTVRITAWRAVDSAGNPIGPSENLPFTLNARRRPDGRVAVWRAYFRISPPPDYYIDLYARWHRVCGGPRHLLRTYHIGTM